MDYKKQIFDYIPVNNQEKEDKRVILDYIETFPHNILLRDNEFAHITSSGFIFNKKLNKVLMIHHNIYKKWAWSGGHADGDADLLYVAIKEAKEETGIKNVMPLTEGIAAIDILPVSGHIKNNRYVCSHLHLSIAYNLVSDENEELIVKEDENSAVKWFNLDEFSIDNFNEHDLYLYGKLIKKALMLGR